MAVSVNAQSTLSDEPDYPAPRGDDFIVPKLRLGLVEETDTGMLGYGIPFRVLFSEEFGEPSAPWDNYINGQSIQIDPQVKFGNARFHGPTPNATFDPDLSVPFLERGFAPGDGYQLKIGPLYGRTNRVTFSGLYSDNVDGVDENEAEEDGFIGIASMDFDFLLQVTEGLQVTLQGALVWLPFENEIGLDGFQMRDPFRAGAHLDHSAGLQMGGNYSFLFAGWDIALMAEYERDGYDNQAYASYHRVIELWEGSTFDEEDRAGRYAFGGGAFYDGLDDTDGHEDSSGFDDYDSSDNWSLDTRVTADRDIPMGQSVYMHVRLSRSDTFTEDDGYFLVDTSEQLSVQFTSERENTRFKPFATYTLSREYDNRAPDHEQHYWTHSLRVGVAGPVTENIYLHADFGYMLKEHYQDDLEDSESELYRVAITHRINPNIAHSFEISRYIDNDLQLTDAVRYSYYQNIGKGLRMVFVFSELHGFERNKELQSNWEQRKELTFIYDVSPKTNLSVTGTQIDRRLSRKSDPRKQIDEFEELEIRAAINHKLTHSVDVRVEYTHSQEETGDEGSRVTENLVTVMITKYFRAAPGYKRPGF